MSIKGYLDQITVKAGEEKAKDIEATLKQIEQSYQSLEEDLKVSNDTLLSKDEDVRYANSESKKRKLKIRELENKISDLEVAVESASDMTVLDDYKKEFEPKLEELNIEMEKINLENETLKKFQTQIFTQNRSKFRTVLEQVLEHPNFEKIEGKIKMPERKDDKIDFDSLNDDEINTNLVKMNEYQELGLFGIKEKDTDYVPKITNKGEIDIVELAKTNPDEARKYLDKKRRRNPLFN